MEASMSSLSASIDSLRTKIQEQKRLYETYVDSISKSYLAQNFSSISLREHPSHLPTEYIDYINQVKNNISVMESEIQENCSILTNTVNQNSYMMKKVFNTKQMLLEAETDLKIQQISNTSLKRRKREMLEAIKSIDSALLQNSKRLKQLEEVLSEQLRIRHGSSLSQVKTLKDSIRNLNSQAEAVSERIDKRLTEQLAIMESMGNDSNEFEKNYAIVSQIYNWEDVGSELDVDGRSSEVRVRLGKASVIERDREIFKMEKRYRLLKKLAQNERDLVVSESYSDIDSLLSQYRKQKQQTKSVLSGRKALNAELENNISSMKNQNHQMEKELERKRAALFNTIQNYRSGIRSQLLQSVDMETNLVQKIDELRLKSASRSSP